MLDTKAMLLCLEAPTPPLAIVLSNRHRRSRLPSCSAAQQRADDLGVSLRETKRVVLVRHGQSTWNEEGRIQGSSDLSVLTPKGESQADETRRMLQAESFDLCFTSPLARAKKTAEIIWGSREGEMIPEHDLREIDLYSFQGLLKSEGKEKFGDVYGMWQKDASNLIVDGHYPVRELWDRAKLCWNKILTCEGKTVLLVAHNAVNQALVATALGLDTHYFRYLIQSNCGVSVLDFNSKPGGGLLHVCLNRLNQTAQFPLTGGSSGGRKTSKRMILVCHGATRSNNEAVFPNMGYEPLNMLGVIQSHKIAEALLGIKVNSIICSPRIASVDTATVICEVQEAADCLGTDSNPRQVDVKNMLNLEIEPILQQIPTATSFSNSEKLDDIGNGVITRFWNQATNAWKSLLEELSVESEEPERNVVVVAHPAVHIALIYQCLKLTKGWSGCFNLDAGSISVLDFPDGPTRRGVVRCVNYTAHLGRWSVPISKTARDIG